MKILSYNIYGVKDTKYPIPDWNIRQTNLYINLSKILEDKEIKVCCFQEVNGNNIELLEKILKENNFMIPDKFPMITETILQYNIVAIRDVELISIYCLPHGNDSEYQNHEKQCIDYGMSDYRTTVFVDFIYNKEKYVVGDIHTDYISIEGKIKGCLKSLNYLDNITSKYKLVVGDMNMISHMAEVYTILKNNSNYDVLARNSNFDISDNSWQGYGTQEQVNVDFAFIPKNDKMLYEYNIIKQDNMNNEASDHRPVIITIV